ncbi:hypothetical protein VdG1_04525 [Verticillium dahliae VDG1]|nr:hypothetical protein VdG1_04525 [Verticillium dahliae VDG1]
MVSIMVLSHGLRRLRPVQVRSGTRGIVTAADVDKARQYCQRQLQHSDYDAHLIQRTLPAHVRDAYLALRTLNLELVRLPEVVTNPTIGAMRMQFWRESIDKTFAGNPPAEPTCGEEGHVYAAGESDAARDIRQSFSVLMEAVPPQAYLTNLEKANFNPFAVRASWKLPWSIWRAGMKQQI